jgi:DNA-binding transcriptional MerR regulator
MDDPGNRPLTLPQVAEIAEVEYPRLHSWVRKGLLSASILTSTGTGSPNLFSIQDAEKARILADLSRAGVEFSSLKEAAKKIDHHGVPDGDLYLSVNGSVEFLKPSTTLADFKGPAIVYPLRLAREATQDAVS